MSESDHNKIIHYLCKELLLPLGVIRNGRSRLYLDDNGYYLTMVEFQPSGWSRGTHLNVGIHFLWKGHEYLSFDAYTGKSSRVSGFVQYRNDEQFEAETRQLIALAAEKVLYYRDAQNVRHALMSMQGGSHEDDKAMFSALNGQPDDRFSRESVMSLIKQKRNALREKAGTEKLPWNDRFDGIE